MNNLALVIFSADINKDLWTINDKLINKYWPNHPKIYLLTETEQYNNFNTINFNYPINKWTMRMRKSLETIEDDYIIFMCDDCFIQSKVNEELLEESLKVIQSNDNIANINFELSFDQKDTECDFPFLKYRPKYSSIRLSLLCGLWNKEKLINVLSQNCSPWEIEKRQDDKNYDYYILKDKFIIHWFNNAPNLCGAIKEGKWYKESLKFLLKEGFNINSLKIREVR